jgi:hypothetical protein
MTKHCAPTRRAGMRRRHQASGAGAMSACIYDFAMHREAKLLWCGVNC